MRTRARLGRGLDPGGDVHRVAERRVLVAQVRADVADDDRAGVDAGADAEVDAVGPLELARVLVGRLDHVERGADGPLGVVLVRDRAPKNASSASPWSWAIVPS